MPPNSFIPGPNADFDPWQINFVTVVNNYISSWDLSTDALAEWATLTSVTTNKKKRFETIWNVVKTKEYKHSDITELTEARNSYENGKKDMPTDTSVRLFITRYIRNNPKVTNAQKKAMGITVPDEVSTETSPEQAKKAEAVLEGNVYAAEHLVQHSKVSISGQNSLAKGEDVLEIQVFIAFTEATDTTPPDMKEFDFDGTVSRGKYNRTFTPSQIGQKAWYYARTVIKGKTKSYGPPSEYWTGVIM